MASVGKQVIGIIVALYVAGIIGPPALLGFNGTTLAGGGINSSVITVWTVLLPTLAVISLALILLSGGGRGGGFLVAVSVVFSPLGYVLVGVAKVKGWFARLLRRVGRS